MPDEGWYLGRLRLPATNACQTSFVTISPSGIDLVEMAGFQLVPPKAHRPLPTRILLFRLFAMNAATGGALETGATAPRYDMLIAATIEAYGSVSGG